MAVFVRIFSEELDAIRRAEGRLAQSVKRQYPPGSTIQWEYNERELIGDVVANSNHDRIKVRNHRTGKAYWIYVYRIIQGGERDQR